MTASLLIQHSKPLRALLAEYVKQAAQLYFTPLRQVIQTIQGRIGSHEDGGKTEAVNIFESPAGARLLAIVHELQNPLLAVQGSAEALHDDTELSEFQRKHLDVV